MQSKWWVILYSVYLWVIRFWHTAAASAIESLSNHRHFHMHIDNDLSGEYSMIQWYYSSNSLRLCVHSGLCILYAAVDLIYLGLLLLMLNVDWGVLCAWMCVWVYEYIVHLKFPGVQICIVCISPNLDSIENQTNRMENKSGEKKVPRKIQHIVQNMQNK